MANPLPLERWLPHLLSVWREGPGPLDGLTTPEADRIGAAVKELSKGLTGDRALAGERYLGRSDLLGAYLLYYWPVSFAQTLFALRRAGVNRGGRALDLGSGPAPGAMALIEAGWKQVTAVDRSPEALKVAQALAARGGVRLETALWDAEKGLPTGGAYDLIVAGHLFNELGRGPDRIAQRTTFLQSLRGLLTPQGRVLILEPAAHGPNADALALRDGIVAAGWSIEGPCYFQGACPARATDAACHDVLYWKVPHLVAQTARRAGIDKRELPFTWLLVSPQPARDTDPTRVRVVSEPMLNKAGRRRVVVCGATGRFSLSAPAAWKHPLWNAVGRGQSLKVTAPELREGGWGLGPSSTLST